jgi:hypothetical protein
MPGLLGVTGSRMVDTAVLSNVGRVRETIPFGELGAARELWFSPPCRMPLGLGPRAADWTDELDTSAVVEAHLTAARAGPSGRRRMCAASWLRLFDFPRSSRWCGRC